MVRATDLQGAWAESGMQLKVANVVSIITDRNPPIDSGQQILPELPVTTTPPKPEIDAPAIRDPGDTNAVVPPLDNSGNISTGDTLITNPTPSPLITSNADIKFANDDDKNKHSLIDRITSETVKQQLPAGAPPSALLASLIAPDDGFNTQDAEKFNDALRRFREQMDDALEKERQQKAVFAGVTLSVTTGVLIWSLRASSLLFTLMSMLPLWRGIDPLPILDEVNKRKKELEQQRKDKQKEDKTSKEIGYLFDRTDSRNERK